MFFIDGPGGTYFLNSLLQCVRQDGSIALAVTSSGTTATLLLDGIRTAHSLFEIPIDIYENSTCGISHRSSLASLIQMAQLILWNDLSMVNRYIFEVVDRTMKDLMKMVDHTLKTSLW